MFRHLLRLLHPGRLATPLCPVAPSDCERVSGPFNGYHIAVYAVSLAKGGYLTFFKICNGEPASYWEACCLLKGRGNEAACSLEDALHGAEELAREEIRNLPALHYLAAHRERRQFYLFELHALLTGRCLHGWGAA